MYWVDAKLHTVTSSNLDGSDTIIVLYSSIYLKHPFSISVFEVIVIEYYKSKCFNSPLLSVQDTMYWSEWESQSIFQADKFNGRNISTVNKYPLVGIPMVIQVGLVL